jgi:four helix bundle protein
MNEVELKLRTKKFAHNCVKLAMDLPLNKISLHLQGQLIRCSTSVAANYRAACVAQSKKSFVSKLGIVVEEADESNFWLEFIKDENLIKNKALDSIYNESKELVSIFISSRKTAQQSLKN